MAQVDSVTRKFGTGKFWQGQHFIKRKIIGKLCLECTNWMEQTYGPSDSFVGRQIIWKVDVYKRQVYICICNTRINILENYADCLNLGDKGFSHLYTVQET